MLDGMSTSTHDHPIVFEIFTIAGANTKYFAAMSGFPNVINIIDCTLIEIA